MLQPKCIEQIGCDFFTPTCDQNVMPAMTQLRDRLTKKMRVRRVSYVKKYAHSHSSKTDPPSTFTPITSAPFTSYKSDS